MLDKIIMQVSGSILFFLMLLSGSYSKQEKQQDFDNKCSTTVTSNSFGL